MSIEARLKELGIEVPSPAKPVAAYIPGLQSGQLVFTSGQLPMQDGQLKYKGLLGQDLGVEDGYKAAEICALNCLGVVKSIIGDLDRVKRIVKITGFVACTPEFVDHPKVINGSSELMQRIFGQKGQHARAAVGMASLPLGAAVEVEMIVEVE